MSFDPLDAEIPEVEESASLFRRLVALSIAVVTLFGATVVLLEAHAGTNADRASRESQRAAAANAHSVASGLATFDRAYGKWAEVQLFEQERILANDDFRSFSVAPDEESAADAAVRQKEVALSVAAGDEWKAAENDTATLSPLLSDQQFTQEVDPAFPDAFDASTTVDANRDDLREKTQAATSSQWSAKAGRFGAVITMLAVVLFLLGLSMATSRSIRFVLVVPAVLLVVWCIGSTVETALRKVPTVSSHAIDLVADGKKLQGQRKLDDAIARFSEAIDDSPSFGLAYEARSEAHYLKGAAPVPGQSTFNFAERPEVDRAVDDALDAVRLTDGQNGDTFDQLGSVLFLAERYTDAESANRQGIALNGRNPIPRLNLAASLVAQGKLDEAKAAYEDAFKVIAARPHGNEQVALYASALSDLEDFVALHPAKETAIKPFRERIVAAAMATQTDAKPGPEHDVGDVDIDFTGPGARPVFQANVGDVVAAVWYVRRSQQRPFEVEPDMLRIATVTDVSELNQFDAAPASCGEAGDYRLDVYVNGHFSGSTTKERSPSPFGGMLETYDGAVGEMCRPIDWKPTVDPGYEIQLESPDSTMSVTLTDVRGADNDKLDGAGLIDEFLSDLTDGQRDSFDGPETAVTLPGANGKTLHGIAANVTATDSFEVFVSGDQLDAVIVHLHAPATPTETLAPLVDTMKVDVAQ